MPAATASCRPADSSETRRRIITAKSATANVPPSSVALRNICAVSGGTELSRSLSTSVSVIGSSSRAEETSAVVPTCSACSRANSVDELSHVEGIASCLGG